VADQLQIVIGADTAPLQQGLNAAEKSVEKFDKTVKKTVTSSGQATLALSNLGRVASDAPFGFIAIANNIEPLIQSFQSLGKQSGGTGGALKALAGSLAGPGGLLLGFSLVSSAVTIAVQKYGSLGKAVDALLGNYDKLDAQLLKASKSYEKFNETVRTSAEIADQETAGTKAQILRVETLAKIAGDQTEAYDKRNSALKELATINKDYFGNLKIEEGLVKGLTTAVDNYTLSVINTAKAKGFESAIGQAAVQLNEQLTILEALRLKRDQISKQPVRLVGKADLNANTAALAEIDASIAKQADIVDKLSAVQLDLETQLKSLTNAQVEQRKETDKQTEANRKRFDGEKKGLDLRQRNIQSAKEAQEAEDRLNKILEIQRKLRNAPTTVALDPAVSRISQIAEQNKIAISSTEQLGKKLRDAFGLDLTSPQIDFKALEDKARSSFDRIATISGETSQRIIGQTQAITASFNTLLAPAIDSVFNALATGQNAFKALGDSLKQLVVQLISTVVKAAALAAIISAVTGTPFNVAFKGTLSGAQQFGALGAGVAPGRIGGAAAPSFPRGTAFTGGGLQLAGNVTFVQRGTDLVGVLNQGNARINRVG
jgi:hypothetical protein